MAEFEQVRQQCPGCGAQVGVAVLDGRRALVDAEPVAPVDNQRDHVWIELMGPEQVGRVTQDEGGTDLPPYVPEAHRLKMGALFRVHVCGLDTDEEVGIERAAELAGAHPNTIRKWIARGALPAHRSGPLAKSSWRIKVADLRGMRGRKPPARA